MGRGLKCVRFYNRSYFSCKKPMTSLKCGWHECEVYFHRPHQFRQGPFLESHFFKMWTAIYVIWLVPKTYPCQHVMVSTNIMITSVSVELWPTTLQEFNVSCVFCPVRNLFPAMWAIMSLLAAFFFFFYC